MRSKVVKMLALTLVLGGASIGLAQPSPSGGRKPPESSKSQGANAPRSGTKSKLEEMLAEALKNNPDIRVAAAKLAEADAELNRTRLQVTQKVVTLYYAIETQKKAIALQEKKCSRIAALLQSRAVDAELVDEAQQALAVAKGKLEELEAQLPALLGKTKKIDEAVVEAAQKRLWKLDTAAEWTFKLRQAKVAIPQAEKIRKALQTPVRVDYKNITLDGILNELSGNVEELSFRNLVPHSGERPTNMRFAKALPVSAILQALADEFGCSFYVREYGILATMSDAAPEGAMTVEQFLRQKPAEEPRRQPGAGKNPPPQNVEGQVKSVDVKGLMTLSIGSDAGLAKGHTLELFRILPASKYLGTIRILEVEAKQSVAQPIGRLTAPPQKDDRVASRISGK